MSDWLGLAIGNSRLHWAWFVDNDLKSAWDTPHLLAEIDSTSSLNKIIPHQNREITNISSIPIYLASVVPSQTALWHNYPQLHQITLAEIPLLNTYATLGIDRALAAYGAGETYHYPCLTIDCGTALTFTGVNCDRSLIGGAILPGLQAQFRSLQQQTAALPLVIPSNLPPRWALDTEKAIASGIIYTTIAGIHSYIRDWLDKFPDSSLVLTGGDNKSIFQYLQNIYPQITPQILVDDYLIFWGLRSLRARLNY
jgi:type III pantothenate kinase